jgi:uncharacterized C2H2 Zn-finger protein
MSDHRDTEDASSRPDDRGDDGARGDGMEGCPKCGMQIRRSEMSIHLAHAHNIGQQGDKKRKGGNRQRR